MNLKTSRKHLTIFVVYFKPDTVMKNNDSEAYNDEDNNAVIEGNNVSTN